MSRGRGKSGSEVKYMLALSPTNVGGSGAGSTAAFNVAGAGFGTVGVITETANLIVNVEASNASNTGFAQIGLSVTGDASGIAVRSWKVSGSQKYVRASYVSTAGSGTTAIFFLMDEMASTPVNQDTNTTVYSTIA